MEGMQTWQSEAKGAVRTLFRRCVQCEPGTPSCPSCPSGQQCSLQTTTCTQCAYTFCIDSSAASASPTPPARRRPNVGAIAGGVIGGLIVIVLATWLIWRCCIKSRRQRYEEELRRQQAEEDEKWANEVEAEASASEQARRSTIRDERASVHTVSSSALIQIAYVPGVTNRSPPSTPGLLVPPVPPLPATSLTSIPSTATTTTTTTPPATGPVPDRHFFMPDIRDSTYSATTTASTARRASMAASLNRSSVATTIYRNNAVVNPIPAQTVIRGKAAVVSVKSSNQNSPNESRTPTPPMPAIDHGRFGRDDPPVPPSPAFSVGSTFLSGAANTAMVATPRPISVRKPSSRSARTTAGDGLPTVTPSTSRASKHSRARRPDLVGRAEMVDDDEEEEDDDEDDEPGARARQSMLGGGHQRDSARTEIEDTPVTSSSHRSPFSDTQAIPSSSSSPLLPSTGPSPDHVTDPTRTNIRTGRGSPSSPPSPDLAPRSASARSIGLRVVPAVTDPHPHHHHQHSSSLSAVIEDAARRAARQPTHGGLGSSNNRDPSPFSDAMAVRTP